MQLLDALGAFIILLSLLYLPGVGMFCAGIYYLVTGRQQASENLQRRGKLLLIFGATLSAIVGIVHFFISIIQSR